jgi:hypothetical protein
MMFQQDLLYAARDTSLPIRPTAVWVGTTEAVPSIRRSRCPNTVDSNRQMNKLFSLGALTLIPPLLVTECKSLSHQ